MTEVPPTATPNVLLPTNGPPAALAESARRESGAAGDLSPRWQQAPAPPAPLGSTRTFLPPPTAPELAAPGPPLVQRKSQRGRWIALALLALVLVAGGVAYFVANQRSPTQAAQARCADVSNGDWGDFYMHSTSDLQRQFGPEEQFVANQEVYVNSHSGVVSCTITTLNQNGSTATGTVVITYGDGSQDTFDFQAVLENGEWKLSQDVKRAG